jgi:hypothetical protein
MDLPPLPRLGRSPRAPPGRAASVTGVGAPAAPVCTVPSLSLRCRLATLGRRSSGHASVRRLDRRGRSSGVLGRVAAHRAIFIAVPAWPENMP